MGPGEYKAVAADQLRRLIHNYPGTEEDLLDELIKQALAPPPHVQPTQAPDYTGDPNPKMDEPFSIAEIEAAAYNLTRNTTPGRDKIPNKLLRNLDHAVLENLLVYINECWLAGSLPPQWKHADVTFIPKPGKPLNSKNLRPISLTSCVGKLFEHLVYNRLSPHVEDNGYFPDTMYGFRPHLSTQDILLQLKEEVLDDFNSHSKRSILALDIKGAFDNVSHQAILQGLASTNCGERTFQYFVSFLTQHTATVGIGHRRSDAFKTLPKGTPQGLVVSQILFNLIMKDLPPLLKAIPNLRHAIYADDLTLWVPTGSPGDQQDALQAAIQVTQQYLKARGLDCAPEKSALLTLCKRTYKKRPDPIPDPELTINEQRVPNVPLLRILGLTIPKDGSGAQTILPLQRTLDQLIHLIRRISHQRLGLQEADTLRIIHALLISQVTPPYLALKPAEKEKLNIAIRQAYEAALGLPPKIATRKLLQLGIHNTWEELEEAHRISQFTRLKLTPTGRATLTWLGYRPSPKCEQRQRIPLTIRQYITIAPIPRNMHPIYNKARREARIRALRKRFPNSPCTRYTDASPYHQQPEHAVSVTGANSAELTAATVHTTSIEAAEGLAIALAATTGNDYFTIIRLPQLPARSNNTHGLKNSAKCAPAPGNAHHLDPRT